MAKTVVLVTTGDHTLGLVQSFRSPRNISIKLASLYAGTLTENTLGMLSSFMNTRNSSKKDLGGDPAKLETFFNERSSILFPVGEKIQVALLLVSSMNEEALAELKAELKSLDEVSCKWERIVGRLIQ